MKTKPWTRKGFTLVELLVVIAIIVALAALATPAILKQRKKMDSTQAISNAKQVYLVLMDFEADRGSFPSAATLAADTDLTGSPQDLSQLVVGGYTTSEEIFYAKAGNAANIKPDDVINAPAECLKAGECGFAYVTVTPTAGTERGLSTSDNGGIPVLCAPVLTGGSDAVFKTDPYDNRGVYLRVDGSARSDRLNADDKVKLQGADRDLFAVGADTVWGTALAPTVTLPL